MVVLVKIGKVVKGVVIVIEIRWVKVGTNGWVRKMNGCVKGIKGCVTATMGRGC